MSTLFIHHQNPVDRLKYKNGVLERFGVYPADIHKDLKCNDGRNDYKKNAKGVRGICLLAGEFSYGEQKSAEDSTGTEGEAA